MIGLSRKRRAEFRTRSAFHREDVMDPRAEGSTLHSLPFAFINKKGEAILINTLDDRVCQQLIDMYLAFQPRGAFQGLPPIRDDACVRWVQEMIKDGVNLVALSFGSGVVGHVALFPVDHVACEMLVVVSPPFQNIGIGTELVRSAIHLAHEIGFETIEISVDTTNLRARHVYKKCGFNYVTEADRGEVDMAMDLKRYREAVDVEVAEIMNRSVLAIRVDRTCRAAVELFLQHHVGSMPVVDAGDHLVGIISKTDLMVPSQLEKNVGDVLTREVLTVDQHAKVARVIRMFQSRKIRCIPVIDSDRKVVGVLGREDVLAYYTKQLWDDSS